MSQLNNWDVTYSAISWVENALGGHAKVATFVRVDDIRFEIVREGRLSPVNALLMNRYVIGVADLVEAMTEFPGINCIFAPGNWCGYTRQAKEYGLEQGVAVFHVGEFMGALWKADFVKYAAKDHKGNPTYAYKSAPPD